MANVYSAYDPIWYANEALIQLQKSLGLASRVYRGYDKAPQQKGSTIAIRKPGTFIARDVGSSDSQDVNAEEVNITLDQWKGVRFTITDKDLSSTGQTIIEEHIRPAAYAIADAIDQALADQANCIPWYYDVGGTAGIPDLVGIRKLMFDNKVPLTDADNIHLMLDGDFEADLLGQSAFTQWQGAGQNGVSSQTDATLGRRFGFNLFANQNVVGHTKGTASVSALALNGAHAKGATTISIDAATVTGTLVRGESFVIAGNTQRYVVTAPATAAGNAFPAVQIFPALIQDYADNANVTVSLDDHSECLAFHRNAFALAMAPLSDAAQQVGARVQSVTDPVTGLSLRSSLWWDGDTSAVNVRVDALFGVKTLDPNLAVRARN